MHEGDDVHFECLVSHEEAPAAQWKLQDVPLQSNEMNLIQHKGRAHSLTLRGVTKVDTGTVTFTMGNHTSTASLTVRGKRTIFCYGNILTNNLHPHRQTPVSGVHLWWKFWTKHPTCDAFDFQMFISHSHSLVMSIDHTEPPHSLFR